MKNTFKYLFGTLLVAGSMVACTPEEFDGMNQAGVPEISNYADNIKVSVNQETNQVTLLLEGAQGMYPYWEIELGADKKGNMKYERSTVNNYTRIFATSGDYTINCRVANRNGISVAAVSKTIHINNTIMDFSPYYQKLAKGPWFIDNEAQGHMGCGPSGTIGTEWWSAAPNDKADWGVYDNFLTFTEDGIYTFDPGESGTVYVNNGVSMWPEENVLKGDDGSAIDFTHKVDAPQVAAYELVVDGSDLYIVLPEHTYFPYIANDDIWNEPRYRVVNVDSKSLELVIDNGGIAWHYLLTNSKVAKFSGFTYDQADNIWKQGNAEFRNLYYAHTSSWEGLPDYEHSEEDGEYHVYLPTATDDKWQAQYQLKTSLTNAEVPADGKYDMSLVVRSSKNLPGMTVKLTDDNDEAAIVDETFEVPGGEDYVFYVVEKDGIDLSKANLKLVFDFGKNPDDCDITIKKVVLIDHNKNTELDKLPSDEPGDQPGEDPADQVNWDENANLLTGHSYEVTTYYSHGDSWESYGDYEHSDEDGVHSLFLAGETNNRWQAQYTLTNWGIALSAEKAYDFRVRIVTNNDLAGVTVKLTQSDDDNIFLTEGQHNLTAGENWIKLGNLTMNEAKDITNLKIVYDFGGNPAETEIEISNMLLQEHQGPKIVTFEDADNLWNAVGIKIETYNAQGGDWHTPDPALSYEDNGDGTYYLNLPSESNDRWQAQFKLLNTVATSVDKKYDFRVIINPTKDVAGATVKWVQNGDDNLFYTDARHDLVANQDNVITLVGADGIDMDALSLVLDFGGNAAETEIDIKGINVQESK